MGMPPDISSPAPRDRRMIFLETRECKLLGFHIEYSVEKPTAQLFTY